MLGSLSITSLLSLEGKVKNVTHLKLNRYSRTHFFPELNYWIHVLIRKSTISDKETKRPCHIEDTKWQGSESVISLLFDETFQNQQYQHLFYPADLIRLRSAEKLIQRRLQIYGPYVKPYLTVSEEYLSLLNGSPVELDDVIGENYFNISDEDLVFLDLLLTYRLTDNANISGIVFNDIVSSLSKLIYIYLDFKLNGNLTNYSTTGITSDPKNLLQSLFEKFVINSIYTSLSHNYFRDIIVEDERSMHPTKDNEVRIFLVSEQISNRVVLMDLDKTSIDELSVYIIKKGQQLRPGKDFIYTMIDSDTGIVDSEGINTFKQQGRIEFLPHIELTVGEELVASWPYQTLDTPFQEMT